MPKHSSVLSDSAPKRTGRRRLRFFRFVYASLTIFAIFAIVVAFFHVNDSYNKNSQATSDTLNEDSELLQWIYLFHGSPLVGAWFLVYFGEVATCCNLERLRHVYNYKYNLLIVSLLAAAFYTSFFCIVLKMKPQTGPKLVEAIIIAQFELCLIGVQVFEEQEARRERHKRKRLLHQRLLEQKASVSRYTQMRNVPGGII